MPGIVGYESLAWVAGLLEGEGSFTVCSGYARISCQMNDADVIERLQSLVGGNIHKRPPRGSSAPSHTWTLARREEVYSLAVALRPLMGARRREQIDRMLTVCSPQTLRCAHCAKVEVGYFDSRMKFCSKRCGNAFRSALKKELVAA